MWISSPMALVTATAFWAASGVPALFLPRRSSAGQLAGTGLALIGSYIGLVAAAIRLFSTNPVEDLRWAGPIRNVACVLRLDALTAFFMLPVFLIGALISVYALEYWPRQRHPRSSRKSQFCFGLMIAAMATVLLAGDAITFLIAWETLTLAVFLLVGDEQNAAPTRRAAWVFLASSHFGALCLFGFFALLRSTTGSFDLWPASLEGISPNTATAFFALGAIGFGLKAGLMPLHFWLPGAHSSAPSHISAVMSGIMLNLGIYGLLRLGMLLAHPPAWWGATLLGIGGISAVFGIVLAAAEGDFKRLLAYSSVENIGIIAVGVGLALIGKSLDRPAWIVLGLAGALLHVWNHSLFKPLLFMGAGNIAHAARTRQIDTLGGLGKTMPRTAALVGIGALAICGLPPLNGFVSEWLIYLGLLHTLTESDPGKWTWTTWAAGAAPALALVGAISLVTFVKFFGTVFCGQPRGRAAKCVDPPAAILGPMNILAAASILIGLFPLALVGILGRMITWWSPANTDAGELLGRLAPLGWLTAMGLILVAVVAGVLISLIRYQREPVLENITWDCGFARPTSRMQYIGSSFSQMLEELFAWFLRPRIELPRLYTLFVGPTTFRTQVSEPVLDRGVMPALRSAENAIGRARFIQRGSIQAYLLYILGVLLFLLLWK
ncbi:MAG: proton-conducting transporter membrane subunit [Tepidisphaeraceae bacterium]|jgi:hydrogenase-4 component B